MESIDVVRFAKRQTTVSSPSFFMARQLSRRRSNTERVFSPGFSPDVVQSMHMVHTFNHSGCVNTANFNESGTLLATGSDDLYLRIWRSSTFLDPSAIDKFKEVATGHSANIFHAQFTPGADHIVWTSAADGMVRLHDLNHPANERVVTEFRGMANMLDFQTPDIVFATNYRRSLLSAGGTVEMLDIRTPASSFRLFDSPVMQVKALAMCHWDKNYLAVGVGDQLWMCDTRMRSESVSTPPRTAAIIPACVVERLTMKGVHDLHADCRERMGTFLPLYTEASRIADASFVSMAYNMVYRTATRLEETSVSSIQFSKQSREMLVSLQGDTLYRFAFDPTRGLGDSSLNERPVQMFAGHLNDETFLKRASYFGPNEEYVCCGGDDGSVFVYDTMSGELVSCKKGDGYNGMGRGIVNGVVPHPASNCFVSYGLDSHAKLWVPEAPDVDSDNAAATESAAAESDEDMDGSSDEAEHSRGRTYHLWRSRTGQGFSSMAAAMARAMAATAQGRYTAEAPLCIWVRAEKQRRIAQARLPKESNFEVPSSSLVIAALEEGDLSVWEEDPMGSKRLERCIVKVEDLREQGNECFHAGKFEQALQLYAIGVHYCFCAEASRVRLIECMRCFVLSSDQPMPHVTHAIRSLNSITERSGMAPSSTFAFDLFGKKKEMTGFSAVYPPPCAEELARLVVACEKIRQILLVCLLNAAQAALKTGDFHYAHRFARRANQVDAHSIKARYRLALALKGQHKYEEAITILEEASRLPEGNTDLVVKALRDLRAKVGGRSLYAQSN